MRLSGLKCVILGLARGFPADCGSGGSSDAQGKSSRDKGNQKKLEASDCDAECLHLDHWDDPADDLFLFTSAEPAYGES